MFLLFTVLVLINVAITNECIITKLLEIPLDVTIVSRLSHELDQLSYDMMDRKVCRLSVTTDVNRTRSIIKFKEDFFFDPKCDNVSVQSHFSWKKI
jgi:hypothetical protein